jgi:hypothetical protein
MNVFFVKKVKKKLGGDNSGDRGAVGAYIHRVDMF